MGKRGGGGKVSEILGFATGGVQFAFEIPLWRRGDGDLRRARYWL